MWKQDLRHTTTAFQFGSVKEVRLFLREKGWEDLEKYLKEDVELTSGRSVCVIDNKEESA